MKAGADWSPPSPLTEGEPGSGAGSAMEEAAADCGAQFRAAVQVIQGLPRSGELGVREWGRRGCGRERGREAAAPGPVPGPA